MAPAIPAVKAVSSRFGDRLDRNVAWGVGSHAIGVLVVFATTPYIARGLGAADYGLMSVCMAVGLWIGFAYLMFSKTTIRFIGDALGRGAQEDAANAAHALRRASAAAGVGASALLALIAPWVIEYVLRVGPDKKELARSCLYAQCVYIAFQIMASVESGVVASFQRLDLFQTIRLAGVLVQGVGWIACVRAGGGLAAVMWWMTATQVAEWIAYTAAARALLQGPTGPPMRVSAWGERFGGFGGLLLVGFAVGQLFTPASRLMTGMLGNLEQVAYLSIIITLAGNLRLLCVHIDNALLPIVSERSGGGDAAGVREAYLRSLRWAWLTLVPLSGIIMFLGDDFVRTWINAEFGAGVRPFLALLTAGLAVLYLSAIPSAVLQGIGRPRAWVFAIVGAGFMNIAAGALFIPAFGARGATYAIALSGAALTGSLLVIVARTLNVGFASHLRCLDPRVALATIACGLIADRLPRFGNGLLGVGALVAAHCALLAVSSPLWLTGEELGAVRRRLWASEAS
ncbi:MAG: polysaccharide biosynthesis protein [Elusimicrobia bacterium]|nr:polysaccharide biosynthesis protein [Elusimicrobiota bacterium]